MGLRSVYGLDVKDAFTPLAVADAGVNALDDAQAEVAVAFSSNPQLSRPDIVTLRDDKRMGYADRVVPVVRSRLLRAYGRSAPDIRRRLNAASAALTTFALRGLNQAVIDGRLPEAVGGEFVEANGLSHGTARTRAGPRIDIGYMDFAENQTLAYLYARGAAGRAATACGCAPWAGCGPRPSRLLRRDTIDLYPAYDGSLLRYLVGTSQERLQAGAQAHAGADRRRADAPLPRPGQQRLRDEVRHRLAPGDRRSSPTSGSYWPKAST